MPHTCQLAQVLADANEASVGMRLLGPPGPGPHGTGQAVLGTRNQGPPGSDMGVV